MLLLPAGQQLVLLAVVWAGAVAGIAFRMLWIGAPRWLYTPCYIALGWVAVFYLPDFARTGGTAVVVLVIAGGLLYTAGAVVYGLKRPDPSPRWFGFHEVFHALTIAAFTAHYTAIILGSRMTAFEAGPGKGLAPDLVRTRLVAGAGPRAAARGHTSDGALGRGGHEDEGAMGGQGRGRGRRPRWSTGTAPTAPTADGRRTRTPARPGVADTATRSCRPGQPQQIERDEVGRPLLRRPGRPGTTPDKPVL